MATHIRAGKRPAKSPEKLGYNEAAKAMARLTQ
jgi:hypothetical protein